MDNPDKVDIIFLSCGRTLRESRLWKKEKLEDTRSLRRKDIKLRPSHYLWLQGITEITTNEIDETLEEALTSDVALAAWHLSGEQLKHQDWVRAQKDYTNYLSERVNIRSREIRNHLKRVEASSPAHQGALAAFNKRLEHYADRARKNEIKLPCALGRDSLDELIRLEQLGPKGHGGGHLLSVPSYMYASIMAWAENPKQLRVPPKQSDKDCASRPPEDEENNDFMLAYHFLKMMHDDTEEGRSPE